MGDGRLTDSNHLTAIINQYEPMNEVSEWNKYFLFKNKNEWDFSYIYDGIK